MPLRLGMDLKVMAYSRKEAVALSSSSSILCCWGRSAMRSLSVSSTYSRSPARAHSWAATERPAPCPVAGDAGVEGHRDEGLYYFHVVLLLFAVSGFNLPILEPTRFRPHAPK